MSAEQDPDAALMLLVKQGDRAAFEQLVDKYKQPVMNLVARMLRDATEAEDVAQNVFVQVHKSAHRYKVSAKFTTWLFTTKSLIHRGRETLKEKLKPYLRTGQWKDTPK